MKKVLILNPGPWFSKEEKDRYEQHARDLTDRLAAHQISADISEDLPINNSENLGEYDAVLFISMAFYRDAFRIKIKEQNKGKSVFMITGLPDSAYDRSGVISFNKGEGLIAIAEKIAAELIK